MRFTQPRSFEGFFYLVLAGLFVLLLLQGCKSPPSFQEVPSDGELKIFMDTSPREGKLVFLGVSGKRSRRQEAIDLALEDAVRRIAIFEQVEGEYAVLSNRGGRLLDYRAEASSNLSYNASYEDYFAFVEFDEISGVFETENSVFVRVSYPGNLEINYRPSALMPDGKPFWVENPPEMIGKYLVGVGYAGRRNAYKDTVNASYENAIFSVIRNLYSVSSGQSVNYRGAGFLDIASIARQELNASGTIKGFYVLETWTDPKDKSVWALAVANADVNANR